jgi:uncharacterized protein
VNRGLLGILVGLLGAGGALWAAKRFFGSDGEEASPSADPTGMAAGSTGSAGAPAARREGLDPTLLEILACPDDKAPVIFQKEGDDERLTCTTCGKRYPVRDGIPVMLVDEAVAGPVPTETDVAAARALVSQGKPALVTASAGAPEESR